MKSFPLALVGLLATALVGCQPQALPGPSEITVDLKAEVHADRVVASWIVTNTLTQPIWIPDGYRLRGPTPYPMPFVTITPPADLLLAYAMADVNGNDRHCIVENEDNQFLFRRLLPGEKIAGQLEIFLPYHPHQPRCDPQVLNLFPPFTSHADEPPQGRAPQGAVVSALSGLSLAVEYYFSDPSKGGSHQERPYRLLIAREAISGVLADPYFVEAQAARLALSQKLAVNIPLQEAIHLEHRTAYMLWPNSLGWKADDGLKDTPETEPAAEPHAPAQTPK